MSVLAANRSPRKIIIGFVILAIGILLSFFTTKFMIRDFPIWFFGKEVTGVVDEKWYELIDDGNTEELSFKYFVRYSFLTPTGEEITGSTRLSAQEWSAQVEGRDVRVVYSPIDPSNNRIDDSRFVPLLVCSYFPFVLFCLFLLVQGWNILSGEFKNEKVPHWSVRQREQH